MTCTDSDDNDMKNTYARVNKDRQKDPTWKTLRDPMSERYKIQEHRFFTLSESAASKEVKKAHWH